MTGRRVETAQGTLPFIEACFGRPHTRVPVWLMRQAGRYLPEYREVRSRHTFLEMCLKPDVAAEVTLQPIRRFGMDAAIIFSDILIFLPALGLPIDFPEGGPRLSNPIRSAADVSALGGFEPARDIPTVYEAIRLTVDGLSGRTPLIGFAGAPFTLACYAIEGKGSKDWSGAKAFMHSEPAAAGRLLDLFTDAAASHLEAQIEAGAQAIQIFDSWAGVLSRADFEAFSKPYLVRLAAAVRRPGIPVIVFARGVPPEWLAGIEADVFGLDWRTDMMQAARLLAPAGVQGNLDPALLLASPERALEETNRILDTMSAYPRFVFNLGHGVLKDTPPDTVKAVVEAVHQRKIDGDT